MGAYGFSLLFGFYARHCCSLHPLYLVQRGKLSDPSEKRHEVKEKIFCVSFYEKAAGSVNLDLEFFKHPLRKLFSELTYQLRIRDLGGNKTAKTTPRAEIIRLQRGAAEVFIVP